MMIAFNCGACHEVLQADERQVGVLIRCGRCQHVNRWPESAGATPATHPARFSLVQWVVWPLILGLGAWAFLSAANQKRNAPASSPTTTTFNGASVEPVSVSTETDARRQALLKQNIGRGSDPELADEFAEINDRYFANALPTIPVVWEPGLAEIGELTAKDFTLKGLTNGKIILLHVDLKRDQGELRRVLSHEMVHQQLFTKGDIATRHGPAFQEVLRRLSEEGAFEGIATDEHEQVTLRAWLLAESDRLHREDSELGRMLENFNREQHDQLDAVRAQRTNDLNRRMAAYNADVAEYNRRTHRYNLMTSYPDGLDEESLVEQKSAR